MSLHDPHCTDLDRRCLICGNLLGKKTLAKEKYITKLNNVGTFYQYHQRFTVLHPPKICTKCCLLMNKASKRNI